MREVRKGGHHRILEHKIANDSFGIRTKRSEEVKVGKCPLGLAMRLGRAAVET